MHQHRNPESLQLLRKNSANTCFMTECQVFQTTREQKTIVLWKQKSKCCLSCCFVKKANYLLHSSWWHVCSTLTSWYKGFTEQMCFVCDVVTELGLCTCYFCYYVCIEVTLLLCAKWLWVCVSHAARSTRVTSCVYHSALPVSHIYHKALPVSHLSQCTSCITYLSQCTSYVTYLSQCTSCVTCVSQYTSCVTYLSQCTSCATYLSQCTPSVPQCLLSCKHCLEGHQKPIRMHLY